MPTEYNKPAAKQAAPKKLAAIPAKKTTFIAVCDGEAMGFEGTLETLLGDIENSDVPDLDEWTFYEATKVAVKFEKKLTLVKV